MATFKSKAALFNQSFQTHKVFKTFIVLASVILIVTTTGPFILRQKSNFPTPSTLGTDSEKSLKIFCSVTQDPPLCFTSISAHLTTVHGVERAGPDEVFAASLEVAIRNISSLPPLAKIALVGSSMPGANSALDHCCRGFSESLSHLNRLLNESRTLGEFSYQALTPEKGEEAVTWLIRGTSGLDVCVDVLDEGAAMNDLSVKVYKASEQARNSVAFLRYKDGILEKIHNSISTHSD